MSLAGVMFVVFLVLKLIGVITWSWWLVTAPIWGSFLLWLLWTIIAIIISTWFERRYKARSMIRRVVFS